MLADITDPARVPASVDETYSSAVSASNLRVEAARRTPADVVLAAGMMPHVDGSALLRLRGEWDSTAIPEEPTRERIEALMAEFTIEPAGSKHAGLVEVRSGADVEHVLPLVLAQRTAHEWYLHELGLKLQRMKTWPYIRARIVLMAKENGLEDPLHVVVPVLLWWLAPCCLTCHGVGYQVVSGTGRTSQRRCPACRKSITPGERKVPHGVAGRGVLKVILESASNAKGGLRKKLAGRAEKHRAEPAVTIHCGERWRARDGSLWDILAPERHGRAMPEVTFLALQAGVRGENKPRLFRSSGHPFGQLRLGPTGLDLLECVGQNQPSRNLEKE